MFAEPEIRAEQKKKTNEYRPIAVYSIEDRIVDSLCARYLRSMFDPDLRPEACAFRTSGDGTPAPQHHDAVQDLAEFRQRHAADGLWVAECDIRGFYDCVHHAKARAALARAIERAEARGRYVDPRAVAIFEAFLASYSFTRTVLASAERELKKRTPDAHFKWPEEALSTFWQTPRDQPIGIPQGSALSCLLANLVLDHVDRAVIGSGTKQELFYRRYCDDMIIVAKTGHDAEVSFVAYQKAIADVALPIHPVRTISSYSKDVWGYKSKGPYRWSNTGSDGVPWVGFVGYQIRHDGLLRIRRDSLIKELRKQTNMAGKVIAVVRGKIDVGGKDVFGGSRRSRRQVIHRLRHKMIAMAVGRRYMSSESGVVSKECWADGFRVLVRHRFISAQLRNLDRGRERQLRRVDRALAEMVTESSNAEHASEDDDLDFWGKPFSYSGQFGPPKDP